jgi:hypothetical protein
MRLKYHDYIDEAEVGAIRFDGYDSAILGLDANGFLVYDYDKMVRIPMEQGMSMQEAIEWLDYNVLCVMGGQGFTVLYR